MSPVTRSCTPDAGASARVECAIGLVLRRSMVPGVRRSFAEAVNVSTASGDTVSVVIESGAGHGFNVPVQGQGLPKHSFLRQCAMDWQHHVLRQQAFS